MVEWAIVEGAQRASDMAQRSHCQIQISHLDF